MPATAVGPYLKTSMCHPPLPVPVWRRQCVNHHSLSLFEDVTGPCLNTSMCQLSLQSLWRRPCANHFCGHCLKTSVCQPPLRSLFEDVHVPTTSVDPFQDVHVPTSASMVLVSITRPCSSCYRRQRDKLIDSLVYGEVSQTPTLSWNMSSTLLLL